MRSYHEQIEVRSAMPAGLQKQTGSAGEHSMSDGADDQNVQRPEMFIWRGRLYQVRAVLSRWQVRSDWWRAAQETGGAATAVIAPERTVWRVEAAAGRGGSFGTYDLACTPSLNRTPATWALLRVAD